MLSCVCVVVNVEAMNISQRVVALDARYNTRRTLSNQQRKYICASVLCIDDLAVSSEGAVHARLVHVAAWGTQIGP